jgi:hypothetical protein
MDSTPYPAVPSLGVPPEELHDADLLRELSSVHTTRTDTLRFGSDDALANSDRRMVELEAEYLRRFPERETDPARLREGSRDEVTGTGTGAW